ncbi:response regulator [Diaminobutyricibacter tongyongensis]|uniref:Response regulator n=1 Tax=Leifsonia tongyongensis TaxID=1268043 RepID=A0A6L9Y0K8_9MICO|nr:response regulator [Diaminobutyricibacter tongyongensis]NEN06824.1 response regulator [Diaminobutyricibacter tongyongensis]
MSDAAVLRRVVIADDDPDIRALMVIAAERAGVEIAASVDNGQAVLDAIEPGDIDLIVLDISMPGMSGLEVVDRMRAESRFDSTRILIVSASVQMLTDQASVEVRSDRFIVKPFSPRQLAATITEMLEGSGRS